MAKLPDVQSIGEFSPSTVQAQPGFDKPSYTPGLEASGEEQFAADTRKAMDQLQTVHNETVSRDKQNQFQTWALDQDEKFRELRGQDAVNAIPQFRANMDTKIKDLSADLPPEAKRDFLNNSTANRFYINRTMMEYGARQFAQSQTETAKAGVDIAYRGMGQHWNNSAAVDKFRNDAADSAALAEKISGGGKDAIENARLNSDADFNAKYGELWLQKQPRNVQAKILSGQSDGLPLDMGADTVKPYTAQRISEVQTLVSKPSPYDNLFQKYGQQYGVDPQELKLRAAVESGLNPKGVGPNTKSGQSGGLMQLTEATAKSLGVTDRFDPEQSVMGAAKLMAQNHSKAGDDHGIADKLYYGGSDQKNWGPNTDQYAENLAAVRGSLNNTPAKYIDAGRLNTLRNQFRSENKENEDQAKVQIDNLGKLIDSGQPLSDDMVKDAHASLNATFNPALRNEMAKVIQHNEMLKEILPMTPVDMENTRAGLQRMAVAGKLNPNQLASLEWLNKSLPGIQRQINEDPRAFVSRSTSLTPLDITKPDTIAKALQEGQTISAKYNVPLNKTLYTKSEAATLNNTWNNATLQQKQAMLQSIQQGAGNNAASVLAPLKSSHPNVVYAAGLSAVDPKSAGEILMGDQRIAEDKNSVLPLSKIDSALQENGYDRALPPVLYDQVRGASRSIFAARYGTGQNLDRDNVKEAIESATGGAQMVGKKYIAPIGVKSGQMEKYVDRMSNADFVRGMNKAQIALTNPGGPTNIELPRGKGGVTFQAGQTPFTLQTISPGMYLVMQPNGEPYPAPGMKGGRMMLKIDVDDIQGKH